MAEKKVVPKHIKEFYDKDRKVKKLLDTTEAAHSKAYQVALEVITDEQGHVDYEMLEDAKNQDKFVDKMMDHYLSFAVKRLGLKEAPKDEVEQDIILQKYVGITKGQLIQTLRQAKSGYTLKQHEGIRDQLMKRQTAELMPLRHGHLREEHIDDILKHTKTTDYVARDRINLDHAVDLLDKYKEHGAVTPEVLDALAKTPQDKGGWGSKVYFTDTGKEAIKKLKNAYKEGT